MKTEPDLDIAALRRALHYAYDVRPDHFTFVPTGWISACYRVEATGSARYFLKLQPTTGPQPTAASSPRFYLPLTRRLHDNGILPHVAYPLPTVGNRLWTHWRSWRVILQNHIDGEVVGHDGMTPAVIAKLGELLGRLHRASPHLELDDPFRETFVIAFEAQLVAELQRLSALGSEATAGQIGLRELLVPRREEVLGYLDELKVLQRYARTRVTGEVVCHTDLHGENLMRDPEGHLYILDWEGAMLSPREQDLFFFAGEETFEPYFLPAYTREVGPMTVDGDLLHFYYLRRGLEDLVDWVLRIVNGGGGAEQDQRDLVEIADNLAGLGQAASTVARLKRELDLSPYNDA